LAAEGWQIAGFPFWARIEQMRDCHQLLVKRYLIQRPKTLSVFSQGPRTGR
jgi:hypothetical protein